MDSKRRDDGRLPQTVRHAVEPGGEVVCGGHGIHVQRGRRMVQRAGRLQQLFPRNERERDEPVRVRRCGRHNWNVHLQDTGRPAGQSDLIWPGLSRTTAACTLGPRPVQRPPNTCPPCDDSNPYCALFIPNCQAGAWGGASAGHQGGANQGCKVNGQQGWTGWFVNWWSSWMTRDSGRGLRTAARAWCSTRRRQTRWRCRGTTRWSRGRWTGQETRSTMAPAVLLTRDIAPRDFPHKLYSM